VAVKLKDLSKPGSWLAMSKAILKETRSWKPDVVLSNSIEVPPTGVPTACIVHDLNFGQSRSTDFESRVKCRFYSARAKRLGLIITVSSATAREMVEIGCPPKRIRVVRNGVNTGLFRPDDGVWSQRSPTHNADGDPIVHFVYPSRILPGKGQHLAIDAIARLRKEYKKRAKLTLVGAAVDKVYLDQLRIQAFGQPVEFALDVPEIASYYQRSDVVLFPTVMREGFGFTAVDGMACGKPVVWADQAAIREATGGIGLSFPPEDVVALREKMIWLMDNPDERMELGRAGLDYVMRHLTWERVWGEYETLLEGLAKKTLG